MPWKGATVTMCPADCRSVSANAAPGRGTDTSVAKVVSSLKAISLDTYEGPNALGDPVSLQRPQVIAERCIGCGICEYKCPAAGEAAIRVYAPAAGPLF